VDKNYKYFKNISHYPANAGRARSRKNAAINSLPETVTNYQR
jgi:hypothetical protein